jgi:hypothetical protein
MELIIERAAGVDVGQATAAATVLLGRAHERPRKETRSFRTLSRLLYEMRKWFASLGVTHVAMEGTGIYWVPVYAILEFLSHSYRGLWQPIPRRSSTHDA